MLVAVALLALAPLTRHEFVEVHLGGPVRISVFSTTRTQAERAAESAYACFAELEQVLSDYRVDSDLNRFAASAGSGPQSIHRDLYVVLERAQEVSKLSDGAFDVTVRPLVELWREARRTASLPDARALEQARAATGFEALRLLPELRAELTRPGIQLDLGGIAKGYACDLAARALERRGIEHYLIQAGGDLRLGQAPPGTQGWTITLAGEKRPRTLENVGVSTSGDTEQFVEIGEIRYSHIVDPRTGLGVTTRVRVSVIGRDAFTTDPIATALCVLGPERGQELAEHYDTLAVFDIAP